MQLRNSASLILVFSFFILSLGLTQFFGEEKHTKEIKAEQSQDVIDSSPFCNEATSAHPSNNIDQHDILVNPLTLLNDLASLIQRSDEVVLADFPVGDLFTISPSGNDTVFYADVRVLRSWKGTHKAGDLLTFGHAGGIVHCGNSGITAATVIGRLDKWFYRSHANGYDGPFVLFLRKDDTGLVDGLTLTAGDGAQGLFIVDSAARHCFDDDCDWRLRREDPCIRAAIHGPVCKRIKNSAPECRNEKLDQSNLAQCNAQLDKGKEPMTILYGRDPLRAKYEGMPVSTFLKEVQSNEDALATSTSQQISLVNSK